MSLSIHLYQLTPALQAKRSLNEPISVVTGFMTGQCLLDCERRCRTRTELIKMQKKVQRISLQKAQKGLVIITATSLLWGDSDDHFTNARNTLQTHKNRLFLSLSWNTNFKFTLMLLFDIHANGTSFHHLESKFRLACPPNKDNCNVASAS